MEVPLCLIQFKRLAAEAAASTYTDMVLVVFSVTFFLKKNKIA